MRRAPRGRKVETRWFEGRNYHLTIAGHAVSIFIVVTWDYDRIGYTDFSRRLVAPDLVLVAITREELYENVWKTPKWRLCEEFDLSEPGLRKLCERWDVPVPLRGYWRRVETGGKTTRIPLPPDSRPVEIRITPSPKRPTKESLPVVHVPERLSSPDELVRRTRGNWQANKPLEATSLDLRVSKDARSPALRIAEAINKELERRGKSVVVDG